LIHLRRIELASADAMTTEPWVSVEQIAQHLGVAKDTVDRWREHPFRVSSHRTR
jgi:transposase-like protein